MMYFIGPHLGSERSVSIFLFPSWFFGECYTGLINDETGWFYERLRREAK
jgi:hypothetical protein